MTAVDDLAALVAEAPPQLPILVDVRNLRHIDVEASEALIAVVQQFQDGKAATLTVRVTTAKQLLAFEAIWSSVVIG